MRSLNAGKQEVTCFDGHGHAIAGTDLVRETAVGERTSRFIDRDVSDTR